MLVMLKNEMIDIQELNLSNKNYYSDAYSKKQIVIGNTFNSGMDHIDGWKNRVGGTYKKTSTFTINDDGKIYRHFDPKYYSDFLPRTLFNKHIISISLVNNGWFDYDLLERKYIDWCGNIYDNNDITEKRWRNHSFWKNYKDKQLKSTIELVRYLIKEYNINKQVMGHNTFVKNIELFEGICYKSNWIKDATDVNPTWLFDYFKDEIEGIKENETK